MTLLHLLRDCYERFVARIRASTIRRLEQDLRWANASHAAHVGELRRRLARLRDEDRRSSDEIARDVARRAA